MAIWYHYNCDNSLEGYRSNLHTKFLTQLLQHINIRILKKIKVSTKYKVSKNLYSVTTVIEKTLPLTDVLSRTVF